MALAVGVVVTGVFLGVQVDAAGGGDGVNGGGGTDEIAAIDTGGVMYPTGFLKLKNAWLLPSSTKASCEDQPPR